MAGFNRPDRPTGRDKHVTDGGKGLHKRGGGLHMGDPVGNAGGSGLLSGLGNSGSGLGGFNSGSYGNSGYLDWGSFYVQ